MATKRTKQLLYRQGDVMFCSIASLPSGAATKRQNGVVAYGEVTGHTHALADPATGEVLEIGDGLFVHVNDAGEMSVSDPRAADTLYQASESAEMAAYGYGAARERASGATFVHQEHGPITLPPGNYRVQIQREYSPEEIRNVAD